MQGWDGVGGVMQGGVGHIGWGGLCRGVVCHALVGWVMYRWGGVGWGVSCRGGVGHVGMGWAVNNFICHKLGVLSFLLTNYCQLPSWIMWEKACFCL